jgi:hypothetical protein
MHGHVSDLGWLWMSFMMVSWLLIVGAVTYVLVKLASRDLNHRRPT